MQYIVCVDGGGTKTKAILADAMGKVVGTGLAGPSNYQTIGLEKACDAILTAIGDAIKSAEKTNKMHRSSLVQGLIVVLGLAGADRPQDKKRFTSKIHALSPLTIAHLVVENDARIALAGATANQPGVVIIAGTGSIALGIDKHGHRARSGGWGPILGDEGSGYAIGKAALMTVLREYDGRGEATTLTGKILTKLDIDNPEKLVPLVYQGPLQRPEIASLARLVLEEATNGDQVSQIIIKTAAKELVELIGAVIDNLGWHDSQALVAGTGGLLQPDNILWREIVALLSDLCPSVQFIAPRLSPALGAVLLGGEYLTEGIALADFTCNLANSDQLI